MKRPSGDPIALRSSVGSKVNRLRTPRARSNSPDVARATRGINDAHRRARVAGQDLDALIRRAFAERRDLLSGRLEPRQLMNRHVGARLIRQHAGVRCRKDAKAIAAGNSASTEPLRNRDRLA